MKAGIVIDAWKLPIFEKHLADAHFRYTVEGEVMEGTLALQVNLEASQMEALLNTITAAATESEQERKKDA